MDAKMNEDKCIYMTISEWSGVDPEIKVDAVGRREIQLDNDRIMVMRGLERQKKVFRVAGQLFEGRILLFWNRGYHAQYRTGSSPLDWKPFGWAGSEAGASSLLRKMVTAVRKERRGLRR